MRRSDVVVHTCHVVQELKVIFTYIVSWRPGKERRFGNLLGAVLWDTISLAAEACRVLLLTCAPLGLCVTFNYVLNT